MIIGTTKKDLIWYLEQLPDDVRIDIVTERSSTTLTTNTFDMSQHTIFFNDENRLIIGKVSG